MAWHAYLKIVKSYLNLTEKLIPIVMKFTFTLAIIFISAGIVALISPVPIVSDPNKFVPATSLYFELGKIHFNPTPFIMILNLGIIISLWVGGIYCFYILRKMAKEELWILAGLIMTFVLCLNDLMITPGIFYYIIPLSMFAYAIEVTRFYYLFHNQVFSRMEFLESELIKSTKLAEVGLATSSINHDIRNSLAIICSSASVINRLAKDDKISRICIKITDQINIISNIFSTYSKLVYHNAAVSEIALKSHLEDVIKLCAPKLTNSNIKIKSKFPPDVLIKFNQSNFLLILLNLLSNAIYAIANHENKWIIISAKRNQGFTQIWITDSGNGIAPEVREHMFSKQYTTKNNGKGMGLGLFLVKSLLTQENGKIYYEPNSKNTTFVIEIPN